MEFEEEREINGKKIGNEVGGDGGEQRGVKVTTSEAGKTVEGRKGKVRRAAFDDLDAIMDINDDVYEGLDYMPALFYTFMHSKLHVIYVYEEDGKLVSLGNFRFHPGCDDLVSWMSIRVRRSHEGRGLGSSQYSPLLAEVAKEYPKLTRYVADTMYTPNIAAKAKVHKWKLLHRWNILLYKLVDRQWLNRFTRIRQMALGPTRPFNLSHSRAYEWLERSDQLVRFLSKYTVDFFPLGDNCMSIPLSRAGLRDAFSAANVWVSFCPAATSNTDNSCSADLIPSTAHLPIEDSGPWRTGDREREEDEIVGLSYSTAFPCKYGLIFDLYFYGDCENIFLSHVYSHLLHYVNVTSSDVRFGVYLNFPLSINSKNVEERLKEEIGDRINSDYINVTQIIKYIAEIPRAKL